MLNLIKLILINFLIFIISIVLIEIFFGYWFDKDNLGPYVREHRLRKVNYELNLNDENIKFIYQRNYYGFRGVDVDPGTIEAIFVGGSTTDERYKPDEFTIVELINSELNKQDINLKIFNAGIEGQSTRGHLVNFDYWFEKIPNFKPKYIIFYIGINDQWVKSELGDAADDGNLLNSDEKEVFFDNLKSRSITYDLLRKAKHYFYTSDKTILYDFDKGTQIWKSQNIEFLNYREFIAKNDLEAISRENFELVSSYLNRVKKIHDRTVDFGSIPIFINQLTGEGYQNKKLAAMNYELIKFCDKNSYFCIDVSKQLDASADF